MAGKRRRICRPIARHDGFPVAFAQLFDRTSAVELPYMKNSDPQHPPSRKGIDAVEIWYSVASEYLHL